MRKQPQATVPLFLRVSPQVKRTFDALARKRGLGKAQMFERLLAERLPLTPTQEAWAAAERTAPKV